MAQEVTVKRTDIILLAVVSVVGGVLIAMLLMTPAASPQFFNAIFVSAVGLAFFLFIPIVGVRTILEDLKNEE